MVTTNELNRAIMDTTMKIKLAFPELLIYITEMPITIPDAANPEINVVVLNDYHNSLLLLYKNYAKGHVESTAATYDNINN